MPSLAQGKRTAILGIDLRTGVVIHNHLIANCYPGIIGCKFVDAVFGDIEEALGHGYIEFDIRLLVPAEFDNRLNGCQDAVFPFIHVSRFLDIQTTHR